jgi:hypothetical protein
MPFPLHTALGAALLAVCSASTFAQSAAPAEPGAFAVPPHQSPFSGYRRYADQRVEPWRETNDRVGRIGGWRAYAREAAGEAPASASAPVSASPASGAGHGDHRGHGKQ